MASGPQTFTICTVFSPERFKGNPLAIVSVRGNAIPQQRKSLIAKEFGYSETVFIHDAPSPGEPRRLDIFTEQGEEIPFAGHPVIGAAHYIFFFCERFVPSSGTGRGETERQHAVFLTKAGPVPVYFNPYRQVAACSVPYNIHLHKDRVSLDRVLAIQPQIQIVPTYDALKERTYPVVSGVKGMTFALIDLTDAPNVLGALKPSDSPEYELDENWAPSFKGAFYYKRTQEMAHDNEPTIHAIQARMITQGIEDPGTGSACCALACYLALDGMEDPQEAPKESNVQDTSAEDELSQKTAEVKLEDKEASDLARERHVYAIHQGVEMGRQCTIAVEVETVVGKDGAKRVANVTLSGRANFFATGQLLAHP